VTDTKRAASLIEVVDAKLTDLDAGSCVQQRHHADERLVRMDIRVEGPMPEKAALLGEAERPAGEAPARCGGQIVCGIDEHDLVLTRPAEELSA